MPRLIAKSEDVPFIIMNELAKRKVYMGRNCSFTYNVVKPGPFNPPHSHEKETQYVFVLSGTMRFIVDGVEIICKQGDMVTFEPGQAHGGHVIGDDEASSLDIFVPALEDHAKTAVMLGHRADKKEVE
ncbi:MAG: cupin domain-containing protein [Candidatus Latescibacterota bacterium]